MKKIYLGFILSFITSMISLNASHNYAGEILVRQIDDLTLEASIVTYSEANALSDRDSLYINWGDGNIELIPRVNGPDQDGEPIENGMKKNIYLGTHVYSDIDIYLISMTDPNRIFGIVNMLPPSDIFPFHIQTEFTLVEMENEMMNTSPILLEAPVDIAYLNVPFVHVANAFDPDGDSLSYELTVPLVGVDIPAPDYNLVTQFPTGVDNVLTLDALTGKITWTSPQMPGLYLIAIKIKSYRSGQETGSIIRDMIVEVRDEDELAPEIMAFGAEEDIVTPVSLGDTINVSFAIAEPDLDQALFITSTCGLYDFYNNAATFTKITSGIVGTANFQWIVKEEHLRQFPYQLVVQAVGSEDADALASFAVFRFRTVDFVSDTKEVNNSDVIKIYPNPTSEYIIIDGNKAIEYPLSYQLISANGVLIRKNVIYERDSRIDVSELPKGWYTIQITTKENHHLQKPILIQR